MFNILLTLTPHPITEPCQFYLLNIFLIHPLLSISSTCPISDPPLSPKVLQYFTSFPDSNAVSSTHPHSVTKMTYLNVTP